MIRKELLLIALLGTVIAMSVSAMPVMALPANGTGLTAKVVAHNGQWITGTINAKGYDIGVYVPPGGHGRSNQVRQDLGSE